MRASLDSPPSTQSLSGLIHQLIAQLATLLRQELTLARTEVGQSLPRLWVGIGVFSGGIGLLYAGFLLLLCAALVGLSMLMPLWLAALSLGALFALAGGAILLKGRQLLAHVRLAPSHLPDSLRHDADLTARKISS